MSVIDNKDSNDEVEYTDEDQTVSKEDSENDEVDKLIKKSEKKEIKRLKKEKKKADQKVKPEEVNVVKDLLSLIIYIGIVILLCYFVIHYVGCRSKVEGDSMNDTLSNGDNLWVDKLSYTFGDPKRFDVIIFNFDDKTTYVKRIIGLPGETVRIDKEGNIYINEQLLSENYGNAVIEPSNVGRAISPVKLGENEYFVMGDNRNNSSDSRWAAVGNVSRKDIVGKVVLRFYPFSSFGKIE